MKIDVPKERYYITLYNDDVAAFENVKSILNSISTCMEHHNLKSLVIRYDDDTEGKFYYRDVEDMITALEAFQNMSYMEK